MISRLKVFHLFLLPKHLLSSLIYRLTRITWKPIKDLFISSFIRVYNVDMSVAERSDPTQYEHFNEFFTRSLKAGVRPLDSSINSIVSPVDGAVSQVGKITNNQLLQAKGMTITVENLLGGDRSDADFFKNGSFINLYLSPKDYHRIHMPIEGTLKKMSYIPGALFSVSPTATTAIDGLFARNERVINLFNTPFGHMSLIMVGAIFVGSMDTVWAGQITPAKKRLKSVSHFQNKDKPIHLCKGDEMGRFNMGSTVIILFENSAVNWLNSLQPDCPVVLKQMVGKLQMEG